MSDVNAPASTIAIDTGGTFTDIILSMDGRAYVLKVPSTPDDPARAAIEGVQAIIALARGRAGDPPPERPGTLIHGSTVATNALLERKGARVALVTNRGFEDIIEIGRQNRPHLYALTSTRPAPLVERALRIGIAGRLDHLGQEIAPLDARELDALHEGVAAAEAVAICLLHSYANPDHEIAVAAALHAAGLEFVSRSSELLPEYREYERTATTVVNAYVLPLMHRYLSRLEHDAGTRVRVMGSSGGALPVAQARREPVHTVLSGPAGGVAGALAVARAAGFDNIITFDMGGTSTDVSLCPGRPLYTRELTVAGVPVAIPMLDIHTVGAGGGSLAWLDAGGALRVGPRSAGAVPGPVCYGRGGREITVTDANVWLGRFPAMAFLGGTAALDPSAIDPPLAALAEGMGMSAEAAATGVLTVINNTMEGALRVISVERGYDPADFTLVAFGGAAGLHAADLAQGLGIPRVLLPPQPGLLSAFGMLVSPVRKANARTVLLRGDAASESRLESIFRELEETAFADMREESIAAGEVAMERFVDARYVGQSHELRVPAANWTEQLHIAHHARYGFANRESLAEAVTLRVEASSRVPAAPVFESTDGAAPAGHARVYMDSAWTEVPVIARDSITAAVGGPTIITEYSGTTWVPAGWRVEPLGGGALLLGRM
jgi:N-methylhydantoinase A